MIWNPELPLSEAYKNHQIFDEIEDMILLYDSLEYRASYFISHNIRRTINYDTYIFMSMKGTLLSIKTLLQNARIADAFVLARKLLDDILVYVYFSIIVEEPTCAKADFEGIQKWMEENCRIPSLKKVLETIKESDQVGALYTILGWKTYLKYNRRIMDNFVHSNSFTNIALNCNTPYMPSQREKSLDSMLTILRQSMMIQFSFLFVLSPQYLMASDYIDSLELGVEPQEGANCWLAPFAQEAFDKYITDNKRLAKFIKDATSLKIC